MQLQAIVTKVDPIARGTEDFLVDLVTVSLNGENLLFYTDGTERFQVGQEVQVEPLEQCGDHDDSMPKYRLIGA
jgi:hypothetical protein